MTHMQYLPGDPRVVDQLVYELKSRGIFDQFRKECISDVDTRPAYQNLRQRVETSVATFLARQAWKPDLNKNQLREKLRKHILDGNYLEQGVERIVDQVVNPKVASVFIPQVEDLVYDFFGIPKKKSTPNPETSNGKANDNDLLPTDLEAVSPGSVKSNDDKTEMMDTDEVIDDKMDVDDDKKAQSKEESVIESDDKEKAEPQDTNMSLASDFTINDSNSIDKISIPLPSEEIKLENIPPPDNSPPKAPKVELDEIELPKEPIASTDIPLPDEIPNPDKEHFFKPINANSDDDSSSDSSLRRNMSPITPIRNFNNENSCDAQQAFENDNSEKNNEIKEPSSFRFTIENKSPEKNVEESKEKKIDPEQTALSYQFNNQVNINNFNTPLYDDSSNSNLLHIDYESDANSKMNNHENKVPEVENCEDSKKGKKSDDKRSSSHKNSHHSRDSHRHSSSKDRRSDSKHSTSRDSSRHDKKTSSKDDHKSKSSSKEESKDKSDKKENRDSRESSKHRSSHKSSSSSHKDSKSHKSSSSSHRHSSSSKHSDEKKSSSSSSHKEKSEKSSDKSKDSKEKSSRDSKSSSHRSDKDRKSSRESSKSKHEDKEKKKEKKETDDHYSLSGRGNNNRRSTDRDSNDGSSSSKGSNHPSNSKSLESKKDSKNTSKSDSTSTSSDSTSPSDKELVLNGTASEKKKDVKQSKVVRVDTHLEVPISAPPRLPFVPDVTLKKPKFAENMQQARKLMKMRKFLDEEQKRMNQEAALLLEFQANVRPNLSQVYSSIPGPELEFACITNAVKMVVGENYSEPENEQQNIQNGEVAEQGRESRNDALIEILTAAQQVDNNDEKSTLQLERDLTGSNDVKQEDEIENDKKAKVQQPENVEKITLPETEKMEVLSEIGDKFHLEEVKLEDYKVSEINEIIGVPDDSNTYENVDKYEENQIEAVVNESPITDSSEKNEDDNKKPPEYFEVTIITEELSETEETEKCKNIDEEIRKDALLECTDENLLEYFGESEKYNAEIERDTFSKFLNTFIEKVSKTKMYLVNCDTYEENLFKEVANNHGDFEIVNYYKNGHFKLSKNIVKDLNLADEVTLPVESDFDRSPMFSPVKSECSFELSSDYDAKLEEMVNKTSRKEIMEIILGSAVDESPSKMPKIDYCMESSIVNEDNSLKRKLEVELESSVNNNRPVLTPNKIRKLSGSDQITSTTEENEERNNINMTASVRSKYLGRARRVGLPRPKRATLPNSPSSDKSVENYEQNTPTPNGKLKTPAPRKVQRYDTSDLYKPKLHYLSRRNNIS